MYIVLADEIVVVGGTNDLVCTGAKLFQVLSNGVNTFEYMWACRCLEIRGFYVATCVAAVVGFIAWMRRHRHFTNSKRLDSPRSDGKADPRRLF